MKVSIYKDVYSNVGLTISLQKALTRIKEGNSKERIAELRSCNDQASADEVKKQLPAVTYSGVFHPTRTDGNQTSQSGFLVLDFDKVADLEGFKKRMIEWPYTYATWVSPSGTGLKVLLKMSDPDNHRDHFRAIQKLWPMVDKTGINPSRLCFESYDPEIYINEKAKVFTEKEGNAHQKAVATLSDDDTHFQKIVTWLSNRGDGFRQGERNSYIYKLSSACCRLGLDQGYVTFMCRGYATGNFSIKECDKSVESAYKGNVFGSAEFRNDIVFDKKNQKEVVLKDVTPEEEETMQRDIVPLSDIESELDNEYYNGLSKVLGIGVPEIDELFKMQRGEVTVITGYANQGKSLFGKWYYLMRALMYGEKIAIFDPEEKPVKFFRDMCSIYCGMYLPESSKGRLSVPNYENAKKFIGSHFLYIDSKSNSPSPNYIKGLFLRTIIQYGVSTVIIDPFNQLANDYSKSGGRSDKYLETFLGDCKTFAKTNNVNFVIIAHPKSPHPSTKDASGNYPVPDMYSIADGAMWGNKADNVLVYYRPFGADNEGECSFHTKKIKDQDGVGKIGNISMRFNYYQKRYFFVRGTTLVDPIRAIIESKTEQSSIVFDPPISAALVPNTEFLTNTFGQPKSEHPSDEFQDLF
jgi:VirE N-terminal domain/KaiC